MKIVKLSIQNLMGLRAIEIKPDGSVVVVSGKNGAGKSRILNAIAFVLGGTRLIPDKPLKDGETEATTTVDLGELIATRTWKLAKDGSVKSTLKVVNKDGAVFPSPQAVLDKLVGELTFDPLEFTRMSSKQQRDLLLGLVDLGINLDELAEKRNGFYEERTLVNREIKNKSGELAGMDEPGPDVPEDEVSVSQLTQEYQAELSKEQANKAKRQDLRDITTIDNDNKATVFSLRRQLVDAENEVKGSSKKRSELAIEVSGLVDPAFKEIQAKIDSAEETNQKVRDSKAYYKAKADLKGLQGSADEWTKSIEAIDQQKEGAIKAAKFPIPGLSVNGGITFNGVPFEQASSAEQLKVSVAIAMALNPRLRVIRINDGSLLDSENMAVLEEMTKDKDFQVWIERVDESGKVGIVIEDGQVAN